MKKIKLTPNAETVLKKRYLRNGESIEEMFKRVADHVASVEAPSEQKQISKLFYDEMTSLRFLPNSPTLMNAGTELGQLSACFVLPIDDSLEGIFEAVKHTALIHKSGGGTGFSFSRLRPKDDVVKTTKGVSSGPVSFMSVFDAATETIKQGGMRRGANMGILRVDHPDIMDFIYAKEDKTKLTNFNLSVGITEEFMKSVKESKDYDLLSPRTKEKVASLNARKVFNEMVRLAWEGGDPAIIFLDRINRDNPTPKLGEMESTNPCGEQPLLPYESCNLGSINLAKFVRDNEIDWDSLKQTIFIAVRFLDNVISCNKYPLPQIDEMTKKNRKIGLGVMGFADMLVQLGIPYNSQQAVDTAKEVMWFIQSMGASMSIELGKERGNFPSFKDSIYAKSRRFPSMRNATITTVAPTGTISIIADASSGIEPYFALAYYRNVMDGTKLPEINKYLLKELKKRGLDKEHIIKEIIEKGRIKDIKEIPDDLKKLFVTSNEINYIWHVKIQAAFQEYTDNAVSKTINLPNSATVENVADIYWSAYEQGCKGITVYRDGSRQDQVLNTGKIENKEEETPVNTDKDRPAVLVGKTIKMQTGCGKMYVTVNQDEEGNVIEVFTNIGKAGGCATSQCEAIGRLITLNLKANHNTTDIIKQLKGISCHMKIGFGDNQVLSCADAVGKAIEKVLGVKEKQTTPTHAGSCPECSGILQQVEGCATCQSCGYSRCS